MPISRRGALRIVAATMAAPALPDVAPAEPDASIALWGDSLTFGTGADTAAGKYPNLLGRLFTPARTVFNGGVGGDSSAQVAARMLADEAHRNGIAVLWAGRNNYGSLALVLADIAAMVAHLRSRRFLVLSVPNAGLPEEYRGTPGYRDIIALNDALQARYGDRFLDVRSALIRAGLPGLGFVPTPQDRHDVEHDVPPAGLRADHIHLNDAGQAVVARRVRDAILRQGW